MSLTTTKVKAIETLNVLIVDSSEKEAINIGELLAMTDSGNYDLFHAATIKDAKSILREYDFHLILLNLTLSDSYGVHGFNKLYSLYDYIPFVVITNLRNETVAKDILKKGAQDYLIKSEIDKKVLSKAVSYAIERKQTIDKLRLSEKRYHDLFHRANEAMYISTKSGDFLEINIAGLKLFGYQEEEISDISVSDLYINDEDRQRLLKTLEKKGQVVDYEVLLQKKDKKSILHCIVNTTVIQNRKGEVVAYQGFIKDISKQKQAERALRKSLEQLDDTNHKLQNLNATLEQKVDERTSALSNEKETVLSQNREITESMNYAKRIQSSILPSISKLQLKLPNSFIFYAPKEIVSGDFYWFENIGKKIYFAVVDCTGHGVPGAFMSIIGFTQLNEIVLVERYNKPDEILKELDKRVRQALKQNENIPDKNKDGMELSFMVIDPSAKTIDYAGAMRPLYYVKKGNLHMVKGDKFSIGGTSRRKKQFNTYKINYSKGDCFYLFTDGYPDQFGGEKDKKFKTKNVGEMIKSIAHLPIENQHKIIKNAIKDWMANSQQIDDMLFAGIKF